MKCGCQGFKSLFSIGGLFLAGMGGYNAITTGCPFGGCTSSCEVDAQAPAAAIVQPAKVELPEVADQENSCTASCPSKAVSCEAPSESAPRTE